MKARITDNRREYTQKLFEYHGGEIGHVAFLKGGIRDGETIYGIKAPIFRVPVAQPVELSMEIILDTDNITHNQPVFNTVDYERSERIGNEVYIYRVK